MKKIAKILAVALAVAIIASVLASCGKLLSGTYVTGDTQITKTYARYKFAGNRVTVETYVVGTLTTTTKGTYKIADGKITFSMVDEGSGTTSKREYTETFSQDGDTLKIGVLTLTKSN